MAFTKAFIPYGAYWSTPFSKWQGSFAALHPLKFVGEVGAKVLADKDIDPRGFDSVFLGWTIPSVSCFYGGPWVAALLGADHVTGPIFSQACATSARCVTSAAAEIDEGGLECILSVTADKCSNGPHLVYPDPMGPGGKPIIDDWVWDNFGRDPWAGEAMVKTAENVAAEAGVTREEQDDVAFRRFEQYQQALADGGAFHKRYMVPVEVNPSGRRVLKVVEGDEGVFPTTREGLGKLRPVMRDGTVTFGSQTHPADGNSGLVITTRERAAELSSDKAVTVQVLSSGQYRTKKGFMAAAVVPASLQACDRAGVDIKECTVKTHNPFAVNDVFMARETGIDVNAMNNYGSSMVFGHPQGPTGMRLMIELIEELVINGGGYGLFAGCAAGDSAMANVFRVDVD
ncbi:MAG: thiolase family protein [Myxococcota bacterium]|nr:thiolase family protein [Myxococcota bacterium]